MKAAPSLARARSSSDALRVEQFSQTFTESAHRKVRSFLSQLEGALEQRLLTTSIAGPAPRFRAQTQTAAQD